MAVPSQVEFKLSPRRRDPRARIRVISAAAEAAAGAGGARRQDRHCIIMIRVLSHWHCQAGSITVTRTPATGPPPAGLFKLGSAGRPEVTGVTVTRRVPSPGPTVTVTVTVTRTQPSLSLTRRPGRSLARAAVSLAGTVTGTRCGPPAGQPDSESRWSDQTAARTGGWPMSLRLQVRPVDRAIFRQQSWLARLH